MRSGPVSSATARDGGPSGSFPTLGVPELLVQMRSGDRRAAAEFITRYGSRIRRRIRGKLSPAMRRIFDSQEILSTVGRRLDQFVRYGRIEAASEGELWALVFRMAENAIVDKARVFRRLRRVEDEDGAFAHDLARRLRQAARAQKAGVEIELVRVLEHVPDPVDRQILSLWLVGTEHAAIADHMELAAATVRKRWQRIKETLHERLAPGAIA